jgi:hypothetical protein
MWLVIHRAWCITRRAVQHCGFLNDNNACEFSWRLFVITNGTKNRSDCLALKGIFRPDGVNSCDILKKRTCLLQWRVSLRTLRPLTLNEITGIFAPRGSALTPASRVLLGRLIYFFSYSRNSPHFIETEGSEPCLRQFATCPHSEPYESSPRS